MSVRLFLLFFLSAFAVALQAQDRPDIAIGEWRAHLNYSNGRVLTQTPQYVYCGTDQGLFTVDKKTYEIEGLTPVQGFSGISIVALAYNSVHNAVIIAYENGYIDILQNNRITTLKELEKITALTINDLYSYGDFFYICTSSGIVEYDLERKEFDETYNYIGANGAQISINSVVVNGDYIYAASSSGVQRAVLNGPILQNYKNWEWITLQGAKHLEVFDNKVWAVFGLSDLQYYDGSTWQQFTLNGVGPISALDASNNVLVVAADQKYSIISQDGTVNSYTSVQQNDALYTDDGNVWIAKNIYSLVVHNSNGELIRFLNPSGPGITENDRIKGKGNEIWVGAGGFNVFGAPRFNNDGFSVFSEGKWKHYFYGNIPGWPEARDVHAFAFDPKTGHAWLGMLLGGVLEFDGSSIVSQNSPDISVSDLQYDSNGILWRNNYRQSAQLSAYHQGIWQDFTLGGMETKYIAADNYNNIWVQSDGAGLAVLNYNNTLDNKNDDKIVYLKKGESQGNLPANEVKVLVKDREGQIWVGTSDGIAVFSEPSLLFNNENFDAYIPWVTKGGSPGPLLNGSEITCITVDGANRKWIGTRSGVWLVSADGTEIIHNFTTKNSPLLADYVKSIGINPQIGEVFFGTEKGIVSYRSDATEGNAKHTNVFAYPNPVRPGYSGEIAIKGLVTDANVKITDITGKLVYETVANGGQATWPGTNFSGQPASSGVYLVFSTNDDGTETYITKILIVR